MGFSKKINLAIPSRNMPIKNYHKLVEKITKCAEKVLYFQIEVKLHLNVEEEIDPCHVSNMS